MYMNIYPGFINDNTCITVIMKSCVNGRPWIKHIVTSPDQVETAKWWVEFYSHLTKCQADYLSDVILDPN